MSSSGFTESTKETSDITNGSDTGYEFDQVSLASSRNLAELTEDIRKQMLSPPVFSFRNDIVAAQENLLRQFQPISNAIKSFRESLEPLAKAYGSFSAAKEKIQQSGLLPHKSTPWSLFDKYTPEDFGKVTLKFYDENWQDARTAFTQAVAEYEISASAKEAFEDALQCHETGLYRSSVLTLLPCVEREFRDAFNKPLEVPSASLKELRNAIKEAPAGIILDHVAPLRLMDILDNHLYRNVKTDADLKFFQDDPIPNRHAAIHGLIDYRSSLNSLNMVIMADYVFFLIHQLKQHVKRTISGRPTRS